MNHFESVHKITSAGDFSWHDNNCFYIMYCISNSKFCIPIAFGFAFQSVHARQVYSQTGGSEHNTTTLLGTTAGPSYGSTDCWIPHFFLLYLQNPQSSIHLCDYFIANVAHTPQATCHFPTACNRGTLPSWSIVFPAGSFVPLCYSYCSFLRKTNSTAFPCFFLRSN